MAGGGGGVPVAREGDELVGVDAVIDKDFAAALIGGLVGATSLLLLTGVDRVALDYGTPRERPLDRMTIAEARALWWAVDRPNLYIKIPATLAGLPAIAQCLAEGISVNVTLIFAIERYRDVMDAYLYGLEQAFAEGRDLRTIHSVASFFVSRVDSEVDSRLPDDSPLRGKAGIANARLAYEAYEDVFGSERFAKLAAKGANRQRPLWASTGVKDPSYPDTMYVTDLVVADTVNTMPEATLDAVFDHGQVHGNTIAGTYDDARKVIDALAALGIGYDDVIEVLESEGVQKFEDSYAQLAESVKGQLDDASK